jgi:hypothetical protein
MERIIRFTYNWLPRVLELFAVLLVPSTVSVLADSMRDSNDRDMIYGTRCWNTISALAGDDRLHGRYGGDVILGGIS